MLKTAIFGYGGHAREVASQLILSGLHSDITFFVDANYSSSEALPISEFDPTKYKLMVAVADSANRCKIVSRLPVETTYFSFIHPTALIFSNCEIGIGSFIGAFSIITTGIKIGPHCILNRINQIGHDTKIGNFFSAMPGAIISGNNIIGDCVYIGSNASTRENINIHDYSIIGSNAAVVKDITITGTYVGVPAKLIT